jgi:ankyrin repeat protein
MIHEKDDDGWTALHWACRGQVNVSLVRRLLKMGADNTQLTRRGWLPRDVAAFHRCEYLADVEVESGSASLSRGVGMHGEIEGRHRVTSAGDPVVGVGCDSCYCVGCHRFFRSPPSRPSPCFTPQPFTPKLLSALSTHPRIPPNDRPTSNQATSACTVCATSAGRAGRQISASNAFGMSRNATTRATTSARWTRLGWSWRFWILGLKNRSAGTG